MAARLEESPTGAGPVTVTAPAHRSGLAWPRLPAIAELATIGAGYAAYALVRLAIHAGRHAAFGHAAQLWQAERRMHLTVEPYLNHLTAARPWLADAAGYYYGLPHFLVTPLVLAWLYLRRPAAFGRLRSALVLATAAANIVFWAWPAAPPRFSVPGMTDILVTRDILGAAHPHGATSLVNLYAAMPSLHVAWAAWCAAAVVIATRSRWRHLAWFYPAATTFVVLASANHFLLDAAGGLAVTGLGMLSASRPSLLLARRLARPAGPRHRHAPRTWAASRAGSRGRPTGDRPGPGQRATPGGGGRRPSGTGCGWPPPPGHTRRLSARGVPSTGPVPGTGHTLQGGVMTRGARPGTGAPAASHPEAARRGETGTGPVPAVTGHATRPASGRAWVWASVLAAGVVAVAAARLPDAVSDARAMLAHRGGLRLAWLAVAVTAQIVSLTGGAAAQRRLLTAGGARLPWRTLFGVVLASTGLARVMPAGPITGGAWQTREYRRRGAGAGLGMWAVLAGGFTSMMVILALLLTGAVVAGTSALPLLACAAAVLATGAAGLIAAPRRARALSRYLSRHHHRSPTVARLAEAVAGVSGQRAGSGWAVGVLACTAMGLLADAGLLTACFGLAGLPVPWRGLLFAYAAGQLGGRLVPLPGGLGGVEGGLLGALTLTGTPPTAAAAAVIVYRVAGYWAIGATGIAVAAALARRRSPTPPARPWRVRHQVVGTAVPWAATEGSTPQVHLRVTPSRGPVHNVPSEK